MSTSSTIVQTESALDLLQHLSVLVPCASCGHKYPVSLRQVLLSQDILHDGCPVCAESECLPLTYAALANEDALRQFEDSWSRLRELVHAAGFDLTISRPLMSH